MKFWIRHNQDWVKLNIHPGEVISYTSGGPTEEGYSYTTEWWSLNGSRLWREVYTRSRDCDGPREYWLEQQQDNEEPWVEAGHYNDGGEWIGLGLRKPNMRRVGSRQRDYFAESMGY